jgi:hemolysin III
MIWLGAYTLGIVFFALDRIRYFHAAWHLFVLAGSVAHYVAILFMWSVKHRHWVS